MNPLRPDNNYDAWLVRRLLRMLAEHEERCRQDCRAARRQSLSASMRQHQAAGGRVSAPVRCPYGWQMDPCDDQRLRPHPAEQQVVARVVSEHCAGKSCRQIARDLTTERIAPRLAPAWNHQTVAAIIRRATTLALPRQDGSRCTAAA